MGRKAEFATIHDVARRAGVSVGTVSKAVHGKGRLRSGTRDAVLSAAAALGYQPNALAGSLRGRRSRTVGLLSNDLYGRFALPVLAGIEAALADRHVSVFLCHAADDPDRARQHLAGLASWRVDGLIVTARRIDSAFVATLDLPALPAVFANVHPPARHSARPFPAVLVDERAGMRMATDHLLALGRTRLHHVTGPADFASVRERAAGFDDALAASGHAPPPPLHGAWSEGFGHHAVRILFDGAERAPDGIACGSDQIARGVADALRERGIRVPDDVALTGYDDWPVLAEACRPPLTSVDPCLAGLGAEAGITLLRLIEGEDGDADEPTAAIRQLPCRLVVRRSCGALAP